MVRLLATTAETRWEGLLDATVMQGKTPPAEALRERDALTSPTVRAEVAALYEEAFPPEERIDPTLLDELAGEPAVAFTAYYDGERFCGFSYSIDAGDYLYLLFLAVRGAERSRGYGTRILAQLKGQFPGRIIVLEVEPADQSAPNAVQRRRRLAFYERNGFTPAGFDSIEGDMTYTLLKTPGPFDPAACTRAIVRAVKGCVPFGLVASPATP